MPYNTWETEVQQLGSYLVNNAGATHVDDLPVIGAFFSGEPTTSVQQTFDTLTSAVAHDTRTAGSNHVNTSGYPAYMFNKTFAFIGGA